MNLKPNKQNRKKKYERKKGKFSAQHLLYNIYNKTQRIERREKTKTFYADNQRKSI